MNWTTVLVFPGPAAVTLTFVALSVRPCGCSGKSVAILFVSSGPKEAKLPHVCFPTFSKYTLRAGLALPRTRTLQMRLRYVFAAPLLVASNRDDALVVVITRRQSPGLIA